MTPRSISTPATSEAMRGLLILTKEENLMTPNSPPPMQIVWKGWWVLRHREATIEELQAERRAYAKLARHTRIARHLLFLLRTGMTRLVTDAELRAELRAATRIVPGDAT